MRLQPKQKLVSPSHKNHQIWGKYLRWLKEPWTTLETPDCNPIQQMAVYSSSETGFSSKTREMVKCLYSPQLFENNSDTNCHQKKFISLTFYKLNDFYLTSYIWCHSVCCEACGDKGVGCDTRWSILSEPQLSWHCLSSGNDANAFRIESEEIGHNRQFCQKLILSKDQEHLACRTQDVVF